MTYLQEVRLFFIGIIVLMIVLSLVGLGYSLHLKDQVYALAATSLINSNHLCRDYYQSHQYVDFQNYDALAYGLVHKKDGALIKVVPPIYKKTFESIRKSPKKLSSPWFQRVPETGQILIGTTYNNTLWFVTLHANPYPELQRISNIYGVLLLLVVVSVSILTFLFLAYRISRPFETLFDQVQKLAPSQKVLQKDPEHMIQVLYEAVYELELLRQKDKLRLDELEILASSLSRNLPDGFLLFDEKKILLRINPRARALLNLAEGVEGEALETLLKPWESLKKPFLQVYQNRKPIQGLEIQKNQTHLVCSLFPIFRGDGAFIGVMGILVDRSSYVALERELRKKETLAEIGMFSGGLAHEFRNSLASLQGYLQLYKANPKESYLKDLEKEVSRMNLLVNRFLEFTQTKKVEQRSIPLAKLVEEQIEAIKERYPQADFQVELLPVEVEGDPVLLSRAILNLLENACQAENQPKVLVQLKEEPEYIQIIIENTGSPIPDEVMKNLYIPFMSGRPDGVGLGLALTQRILHLHGGFVTHANIPKGVKAVVSLPRGNK